jgi:CO/xanthine dehydrogenase FAD-binding subunit
LLAGGTDLLPQLKNGLLKPAWVVDLSGVERVRTLRSDSGGLRVGAAVSARTLERDATTQKTYTSLAESGALVGSVQIRNLATLGGNLCNAAPSADMAPPLLALEGVAVIAGPRGERRVPIAEFFTGYRATVLRPDELIVAVEVPSVDGRQWFRKVGTRAAQAISKVVVAGVRGAEPRFALGSVAPTVVRARETERALASGASVDEAAEILGREIAPIDDVRSTGAYRRTVSMNLLRRFWSETA